MTGGKLLGLLLLALIAGILSLIVGTARLLFRLADRGGRRAWKAIADSKQNIRTEKETIVADELR